MKMVFLLLLSGSLLIWLLMRVHYPAYPSSPQFDAASGRFANTPPTRPLDHMATAAALWAMMTDGRRFMPPQPLPSETVDWAYFLAATPDKARLVWFGHSSVMLRMGGQTVFIDPVFADSVSPLPWMMRRFQAPPAVLQDVPPPDVVVYSHSHYDHLDKRAARHFAANGRTRFIVPLGMGALLRSWGVAAERIEEADWWQTLLSGSLRLTAVPARHNSGRGGGDRDRSLWTGWVLESGGEKIYYSGDSSYGTHFAEIGRRFGGFDLALVENGQYNAAWPDNHMFPEQTAQAVRDVGAVRFMPVHWGAYALSTHAWDGPVRRSLPLAEAAGVVLLTPKLGQVVERDSVTAQWWQENISMQ